VSNLKKLLPILAIVAVVGVGWFLFQNKKGGGASIPGITKSYSAKGLKAVVDLGIPVKCSYQIGEMKYEGYVKGKQWRGRMEYPDGRKGEVIMKGNCMWSWTNEEAKGIKMCFEPTEDGEDMWSDPQYAGTDIDYKCSPAAITDAQFNPPTNIQFMDMDDLNQMMMDPESFNTQDNNAGIPDMPETIGIPDSPEDFDMTRYQE